jgi:hypothetical protein
MPRFHGLRVDRIKRNPAGGDHRLVKPSQPCDGEGMSSEAFNQGGTFRPGQVRAGTVGGNAGDIKQTADKPLGKPISEKQGPPSPGEPGAG